MKKTILLFVTCVLFIIAFVNIEKNISVIGTENESSSDIFRECELNLDGLKLEVLSCTKIEDTDIHNQTQYPAEYFYSGELPDPEYTKKFVDREAIMEACPELKDMWEHSTKYSYDEQEEIYKRNLPIIEQYTSWKHPKTSYLFAKCRIINTSGKMLEHDIDLFVFISSENSEYLAMQEGLCYFDKAVHTEGEDRALRFFWYPFQKDEVLDCVLGFEVEEVWNDKEAYFIGIQIPGIDNRTLNNTPCIPLLYR